MKLRIVIDRLETTWVPYAWCFRLTEARMAWETYRMLKNNSRGVQYRIQIRRK